MAAAYKGAILKAQPEAPSKALPDGRRLLTLRDVPDYITKLPKAEHSSPEWQTAIEIPMLCEVAVSMNNPLICCLNQKNKVPAKSSPKPSNQADKDH